MTNALKEEKHLKPKLFDIKKLPMDIARLVLTPLLIVFRIKRLDTKGMPYNKKIKSGAIIAANHTGFADPFLVGCCFWYRRMYCWASEEVMGGKIRSALLKGAGCIGVNRKIFDINAIRTAVDVLKKEKRLMTVFPQGQIQDDKNIEQVKNGVALIALQSGAPIYPVYTKKKSFFTRRSFIIGEPIYCNITKDKTIPSLQDINDISQQVQDGINACRNAYNNFVKE